MSDTSNHYIGKSDHMLHDEMEREMLDGCMKNLVAFVLALLVCAVITICCGCSRKVSEDVEEHTTSHDDVSVVSDCATNVVEQSSTDNRTDAAFAGVLTRLVDDSLDMTLKVTEYGDDGQPKKVTEATLHRGKKDRTAGVVNTDCHISQTDNSLRIEDESSHVDSVARHDDTEDVKHVFERRSWWSIHWRMVLSAVAAAVMVALAVWKRRRWLPIMTTWIRKFLG